MKTRAYLLIITILLFALSVTAFAGDKETIVFWYGATQEEQVAYKQMIAEFEKKNPGIEVNAMLIPQKYVERKLILSISGGVPPDVVRFYAHLGGELMSRGALERMDDLARRDKLDLQDFYPVGIKQNTYQGRLYGMPWVLSPNALFYNKQAFREAGLDPNKPPKTWAELEKYAMKLTKRDAKGNLTSLGFADFLYNPNNFALYTWQTGGDLISANGLRATFNGPEGKQALEWMKSFLAKEVGSVTDLQTFAANFKGSAQDPFGQGLLAMRIDSPFRIPELKKYFPNLDYGITMIPYDKVPASEVVGNSLVIPRGSRHREAAWKFVKFASSSEQMQNLCRVSGRIPARISAARSPEYYNNPRLRPFIDQIPHGHSVPVVAGWQEVSRDLATNIENALKGNVSTDKALDIAAKNTQTILARANEDMRPFPVVPWKAIGIVAFVALLIGCTVTWGYVKRKTGHSRREFHEAKQFYLFAAPWIIGFLVFTFGATAASLVISFSKWDTLAPAHFIGLRNYKELFTADPLFYKSLMVTFYYAVFSIPVALVGGLAVSVLMNQKVFGIRLFRTVYYLPAVISGVATAILWQFIFNPTSGLLNQFLSLNVIPWVADGKFTWISIWGGQHGWFLDPVLAMPAFIIMGFWSVGGAMVIYLAALQGVPESLYEAAKIDGAGPWKSFRNVTLPLLTPAIFYQLVVGTMYSLQMFMQPYIMTDGNPENATLFYALYLFRNAFEMMKMGYASAMAWILFIVVLGVTLIHFKLASRWVYYEGAEDK